MCHPHHSIFLLDMLKVELPVLQHYKFCLKDKLYNLWHRQLQGQVHKFLLGNLKV